MGSRSSAGRSVSMVFVLIILRGSALDGSMYAWKRLSATQDNEHARSSLADQSHIPMYMQESCSPQTCSTTQHSGTAFRRTYSLIGEQSSLLESALQLLGCISDPHSGRGFSRPRQDGSWHGRLSRPLSRLRDDQCFLKATPSRDA